VDTKQLGLSEVSLPAIGIGTWHYQAGAGPLLAAVEHGASFIDTAEIYGTEQVVGEAVRGIRHKVFVATKVAPRNFRKRDILAAADASLSRLGTDYIDLYQLHWPNYKVPIAETISAMEDLVDAGKIRFIGVSNFSTQELVSAQKAMKRHKIVSNQVKYSLVDRTIEDSVLPYCQTNNVTVLAYSPLGNDFAAFRRSDSDGRLTRIAQANGKSEAQVALNWLISKPGVIAIPKASTRERVIENCGAADWRLSDIDCNALAEIACIRKNRLYLKLRQTKRFIAQSVGRQL
jgi:diketogulonate reductase-like aldo/keto reductase